MQSGISRLAAVLRSRQERAGELFCARVTPAMELDDGCGLTVPAGDYLVCSHAEFAPGTAPALSAGMEALCAWVDGRAIVLGTLSAEGGD